jgi:hypothetical protein
MAFNLKTILVTGALITPSPAAFADVITDWNEKATALVTARQAPPQVAERVMAMVHVAMFDAVNSVDRRYRPYFVQLPATSTTSKEAAAAAAAGTVLMELHPQAKGELTGSLAAYLATVPDSDAKSLGIKLGEAVAMKILETRASDGVNRPDAYRPKTKPGLYIATATTLAAEWPTVPPFAMKAPAQFRPVPPVSLTSEQWAADYNEIKSLGARASTTRSPKQTEDARFWLSAGPVIYYPVVRQLAQAKTTDVVDSARFMALVAVARVDAFIAVFDAKYHYEFWRPITAIRNGDIDDNPATEVDPTWQPIADTPMHPEYPCAHCILSSSIASVTRTLFGSSDVPAISLTSPTAPGVTHRWTSMKAFADEVSKARISAGFHYRFSARVGQEMGDKIGEYVVRNVMLPVSAAAR